MNGSSKSTYLNGDHLLQLRRAQRQLADLLPQMDMADQVGIDTTEFRNGHAFISGKVNQYISTYFPDEVTPGVGPGVPRSRG